MLLFYLYECQGCGKRQWYGPHESLTGDPATGWIVECAETKPRFKVVEVLHVASSKQAPISPLN